MKKFVIFALVALLATPVLAQEADKADFGARAGFTFSPDQFHFGAHADLGAVIKDTRLVPNIEFGFGDHLKVISLGGDLIYDFKSSPFSLGGELALIYTKLDLDLPNGFDDSNTDFGLSVLGQYHLALSNGKILTFEAKLGLVDSPDFKATVCYDLF